MLEGYLSSTASCRSYFKIGVDDRVSTSGRARCWVHRVVFDSLDQSGDRTAWPHERRLMKIGVSITEAGRARVWVSVAPGEPHIQRGFPSLNTRLDSCTELGIEEDGASHVDLVLDIFDDVIDLVAIRRALFVLSLLAEHLEDAVLTYLIDGGVPEFIHRLLPLISRGRHRLHLIDPSRQVVVKSLGQ